MICPRCRRQNPPDAIFCNRCGLRLQPGGVYYRNRHQSQSIGVGQVVLGLGVLILAGVVLGGAGALLLSTLPNATPTRAAGGPSGASPLPTFDQATSTPIVTASPTPPPASTPTLVPTPTLAPTVLPTVSPSPTPSATAVPTPEPTAAPTRAPTPRPTPAPTPVDCAVAATGANVKTLILGLGNASTRGPLPKVWCLHTVTISPVSGWGTARLLRANHVIAEASCLPGACEPGYVAQFAPPERVRAGATLRYEFVCYDDPLTIDINECADATADGATISINYEAFAGP